jgi:CRISPR/Cas system CSM-associated protein Csm2 small subunit
MRGKNELEQKKSIKRGVAVEVVATAISRSKKSWHRKFFAHISVSKPRSLH